MLSTLIYIATTQLCIVGLYLSNGDWIRLFGEWQPCKIVAEGFSEDEFSKRKVVEIECQEYAFPSGARLRSHRYLLVDTIVGVTTETCPELQP